MSAVLAAAPIAVVLGLILTARVSAAAAGALALATACAIASTAFDFAAGAELASASAGVAAEALFFAGTILWILVPALALHELQVARGSINTLRAALSAAAPDLAGRTLLVGWFFALFIEGAAGFGTPLVIAAPILVALGFSPARAVAAALLGHVSGVAFGAVGTPLLAQVELTAVAPAQVARYTAALVAGLAWIPAVYLVYLARKEESATGRTRGDYVTALNAAAFFLLPFTAVAVAAGPELPALAGAVLGGFAFVMYLRHSQPRTAATPARPLLVAAAPYLILIALVLVTRLVAPVAAFTTSISISWSLPGGYAGRVLPLHHPGTLLLLAFVLGGSVQKARGVELLRAVGAALRRVAPAALALVTMLALARLMLHAGMIDALAGSAAGAVGAFWPLLAPVVGALGSFVTGSATASNILFTTLQAAAAERLSLPAALIVSSQAVGAAVGNAICPHNIIAGAAAVGAVGREGQILRSTLPICALLLATAGALTTLAVAWLG